MDDPYTTLQDGDEGTITQVDDAGVIHVNWDNGSSLGLIPNVDQFTVLNEDENRYRPFPKERNSAIGSRNAQLYQRAEENMMPENGTNDGEEPEEEIDPYDGKECRFRVSFYADIHVPMTANLEHDRQMAEQAASEVLKKLNQKDISNVYLGGVAHNPFATMPDPKEFNRL
jgi:hypothetical protein